MFVFLGLSTYGDKVPSKALLNSLAGLGMILTFGSFLTCFAAPIFLLLINDAPPTGLMGWMLDNPNVGGPICLVCLVTGLALVWRSEHLEKLCYQTLDKGVVVKKHDPVQLASGGYSFRLTVNGTNRAKDQFEHTRPVRYDKWLKASEGETIDLTN